jgi:hypothetical protein
LDPLKASNLGLSIVFYARQGQPRICVVRLQFDRPSQIVEGFGLITNSGRRLTAIYQLSCIQGITHHMSTPSILILIVLANQASVKYASSQKES